MKIHEFELTGKFAHWRRYYSNSSSLTYFYPSRTNVIGILASVLMMSYDSYYEVFSKKNLDVSVSVNSPLRKQFHLFNYRSRKSQLGITQVRCELINEKNNGIISYKIFLFAKNDETKELVQRLIHSISRNDLGYGVYLGQRQHKGFLEYVQPHDFSIVEKTKYVNSICLKSDILGSLDLDNPEKCYNLDTVPLDFDKTRQIVDSGEYVVELNKSEVSVKNGFIKNVFDLKNGLRIKFF